jgi:hypothetical protein
VGEVVQVPIGICEVKQVSYPFCEPDMNIISIPQVFTKLFKTEEELRTQRKDGKN